MTSSDPDSSRFAPLSVARKTLLVFCDSLSYYGPQGGLPADDPRIWPNLVAAELGWGSGAGQPDRLDLPRRLVGGDAGPACLGCAAEGRRGDLRDQWHGLAADRAAADRAAGLIRYVRPSGVRRWVRDGYGWLQPRLSPVARPALPRSHRRISRNDPRCNRFQPPGDPDRRLPAVGAYRQIPTAGPSTTRPGTVTAITDWAAEHQVPLVDLKEAVAEEMLAGRGNPDGIHWNFEAHRAVADLMLKALAGPVWTTKG